MSIVKKIRGRLIGDKEQKLLELDPDRFYVENIRSFYNLTTPVARFLCELAVKQRLFDKKFGLFCPNDGCGRMIKSYAPGEPIDNLLTCKNCEILNRVPYEFPSDSLERMTYYKLRRKDRAGLMGKIQLVEQEETGEMELVEPKETRETKLDEPEEARKTMHYDMEKKLEIANIILNLFWKSVFSLVVLVAFVIVLVLLCREKTLEYRIPFAFVETVFAGTMFPVFNHFFPRKQHVNKG